MLIVMVALVVPTWSFGSYVAVDNGDTASQRAVTWARDHHLGGLVDTVERWTSSDPPSATPAGELTVNPAAASPPAPPVAGPTSTSPASPASAPAAPEAPGRAGPPEPLTTVVVPPLASEGQWRPIARAAGLDAVWATSIRPLRAYPSVVASVALIDQTNLRFGLFNGDEVPGHGPWRRGDHVPTALQPSLVAAFNGGFRFDNEPGGYVTEGRTVRPLLDGQATLAITSGGKLFLGEYGRDLTNDRQWISLRQNLPLIVDQGVSQVPLKTGTLWGKDYHNVIYVLRSALCATASGRFAYVVVGPVDASLLGQSLVNLGCRQAIELDINGTWPTFFTFPSPSVGRPQGVLLDRRMGGSTSRYLTGSSKDFFAMFDTTAVPAGSALEAP